MGNITPPFYKLFPYADRIVSALKNSFQKMYF